MGVGRDSWYSGDRRGIGAVLGCQGCIGGLAGTLGTQRPEGVLGHQGH